MDITRRDLFTIGGKLLVLASVGATLEQILEQRDGRADAKVVADRHLAVDDADRAVEVDAH